MTLQLVTIPCLSDNYAYLIHDADSGQTAVIDVPEAGPIVAVLKAQGWTLTHILLTHHHYDHIDGVADLLAHASAEVIGAAADAHRLPPLHKSVNDGDTLRICGEDMHVMDVSGHTVGHIAFHFPASKLVFTADSLMAMGCGRLFEGTPAQMHASLSKLAALPGETTVCSGHEYTESNVKFALTIDPDNPALISRADAVREARADGQPTVPSLLSDEMATNPFLRADNPAIQAHLGLDGASTVDVFTEIRARKDSF